MYYPNMQIEIYSTPNCQYCDKAKTFFKEGGYDYTEYNVAEDMEKKAEAIELTGRMGVPVIRIDNDVFYGWDENGVRKVLGRGL